MSDIPPSPFTPASAIAPEGPPSVAAPLRNKGGRPRGSKIAKRVTRFKRSDLDAVMAGVGSTQRSETGKAEPTRQNEAETVGRITRMSLEERQTLMFDLPPHRKKPGWDYQWQVVSIMGMREDRSKLRDAHRAGWRPELAKDWPELAEGLAKDDPIEERGQMLMGRPMSLSHEARVETYNKAKNQEYDRMQAAAGGKGVGGQEGLVNIRGIEVRNPSLSVELSSGGTGHTPGR